MNSKNKIICILTILLIILSFEYIETKNDLADERNHNVYLTKTLIEIINENNKISPRGFSIGENITSNIEGIRYGLFINGTIVGIQDSLLTYKPIGEDEFNAIDDRFVKHVP